MTKKLIFCNLVSHSAPTGYKVKKQRCLVTFWLQHIVTTRNAEPEPIAWALVTGYEVGVILAPTLATR